MMLIKILILTICVTGCSGHQMLSGDSNGEIDGDLVQPQEIIDIVEEELLDENLKSHFQTGTISILCLFFMIFPSWS